MSSEARSSGLTPVGGSWDYSLDSFGIKVGFGMVDPVAEVQQMKSLDEDLDDGDLLAGKFRRVSGDRYYYVIEDMP